MVKIKNVFISDCKESSVQLNKKVILTLTKSRHQIVKSDVHMEAIHRKSEESNRKHTKVFKGKKKKKTLTRKLEYDT